MESAREVSKSEFPLEEADVSFLNVVMVVSPGITNTLQGRHTVIEPHV